MENIDMFVVLVISLFAVKYLQHMNVWDKMPLTSLAIWPRSSFYAKAKSHFNYQYLEGFQLLYITCCLLWGPSMILMKLVSLMTQILKHKY